MSVSPEVINDLDNRVLENLKHLRNVFFWWLVISSLVVGLGVVLEEFRKLPLRLRLWWFDKNTGRMVIRHRLIRWIERIELMGWILVIAGVVGEGIFEYLTSSADGLVQDFSQAMVEGAQHDVSVANEQAARDEADNLSLKIELAQQEQATAEAAKAAAEANAKLGGWKLDITAKDRITAQLKKFAGTHFDLAVNPVEAPFMESLDALLVSQSVGWIEDFPVPKNGSLAAILVDGKASIILSSGIILEVDQDRIASLKPAVVALGTVLHEEVGLRKVTLHLVPPGSWGNKIHIIIGKRQ